MISFLIHQKNLKQNDAEKIFSNIIEDEFRNGLKNEVGDNAKKEFNRLYNPLDWAKKLYSQILKL